MFLQSDRFLGPLELELHCSPSFIACRHFEHRMFLQIYLVFVGLFPSCIDCRHVENRRCRQLDILLLFGHLCSSHGIHLRATLASWITAAQVPPSRQLEPWPRWLIARQSRSSRMASRRIIVQWTSRRRSTRPRLLADTPCRSTFAIWFATLSATIGRSSALTVPTGTRWLVS